MFEPWVIGHEAGHLAIPRHGFQGGYNSEGNQRWLDSLTHAKGTRPRKQADASIGLDTQDETRRSGQRALAAKRLLAAGVPASVIINGLYQQGQIEESD